MKEALAESGEVSDFIAASQPTSGKETGRLHIAVALFGLATHHREAALLLAHVEAWPSMFALQRSIWEALMRGYHVVHCLNDVQHGRMVQHQASPTMETVVKDLRALGPEHAGMVIAKHLIWDALSDYTHGGVRQVSKWLRTDVIEPHFTDDEKVDCLWFADQHGLLASMMICELFGGSMPAYVEMASTLRQRASNRQRHRHLGA